MRRIKRFVLAQSNATDITWKSSDNFYAETGNNNVEKHNHRRASEDWNASVLISNESVKLESSVSSTSLQ